MYFFCTFFGCCCCWWWRWWQQRCLSPNMLAFWIRALQTVWMKMNKRRRTWCDRQTLTLTVKHAERVNIDPVDTYFYRNCNANLLFTQLMHAFICSFNRCFLPIVLIFSPFASVFSSDTRRDIGYAYETGIDYQRMKMKNHGIICIFSANANGTHNVNTTYSKWKSAYEKEAAKDSKR